MVNSTHNMAIEARRPGIVHSDHGSELPLIAVASPELLPRVVPRGCMVGVASSPLISPTTGSPAWLSPKPQKAPE